MLAGRKIEDVPFDELTQYACEDTDQTLQLYHFLENKSNNPKTNQNEL